MSLHPAARVILLTGPSGTGKSSLAERTGLPVLRLDDFYKEGDDPTLPPLPDGSGTDWDSPRSWDAKSAVAAVRVLARTGRAEVPVYSIASSSVVGRTTLELHGAPVFIAEGIFAAEITDRCRELGLLADALCLHGRPFTTFRRRLLRDLREGRKAAPFLVRRGWSLMRQEGSIVDRQTALGAFPCGRDEALRRVESAVRQWSYYGRPAQRAETAQAARTAVADTAQAAVTAEVTVAGGPANGTAAGPAGPPAPAVG